MLWRESGRGGDQCSKAVEQSAWRDTDQEEGIPDRKVSKAAVQAAWQVV
jgi:hypothetical protein